MELFWFAVLTILIFWLWAKTLKVLFDANQRKRVAEKLEKMWKDSFS